MTTKLFNFQSQNLFLIQIFFWFWNDQKEEFEYFGLGYFSITFEAAALADCGDLLAAALKFPKVENNQMFEPNECLKSVFKTKAKNQQSTISMLSRSSFLFQPFCSKQ